MIVPSIDIMGGRAVQLRGGRYPVLDAGDPWDLATRLSRAGEIAVVDLDAALGKGDNRTIIKKIAAAYPARVGGGIRDLDTACELLDAGAHRLMIGTKADPEFLSHFPAERLIVALDMKAGKIMVEGWTKAVDASLFARMKELSPYAGGFLVTCIDREGSMEGLDMERAAAIVEAAACARVTFAGGTPGGEAGAAEIAALQRLQSDVQAGTALATGGLSLGQAFRAGLSSPGPDGLWPTIVCDEGGRALGLAWSDAESIDAALETGSGIYHSRTRGRWVKGESSGDRQRLLRIDPDCDGDALRFRVRQEGRGFCHTGRRSCFDEGLGIERLSRTIESRKTGAPEGSYTRRLFEDTAFLGSKLREEADELAAAIGPTEAAAEAADVLYFALTKAYAEGATLSDIESELDRRTLKVRRRGGAAKPGYAESRKGATWNGIH
ncbi:MAG: phosphoribosyl-ATP diphosphatase [Rectinemataceae bacterium]